MLTLHPRKIRSAGIGVAGINSFVGRIGQVPAVHGMQAFIVFNGKGGKAGLLLGGQIKPRIVHA